MFYVVRTADSEVVALRLLGRDGGGVDRNSHPVNLWIRFVLLLAIAMLLIATVGCAAISDRRTVAGCQVADGLTTYVALKKGAVELNGIFAGLSGSQILALKLALAWIVYKVRPEKPTDGERFAMTFASGMGCIPALSNVNVIRNIP